MGVGGGWEVGVVKERFVMLTRFAEACLIVVQEQESSQVASSSCALLCLEQQCMTKWGIPGLSVGKSSLGHLNLYCGDYYCHEHDFATLFINPCAWLQCLHSFQFLFSQLLLIVFL